MLKCINYVVPIGPLVAIDHAVPVRGDGVAMLHLFLLLFSFRAPAGKALSLRGFRQYVGRLPINPYPSFNATEHVCPTGSRGMLAQEDPTVWWDAKARRYRLLMHQFDCRAERAWGAVGGYAQSRTADFFGAWDCKWPGHGDRERGART